MEERVKIAIKNTKREMDKITFEIQRLEWQLKYAPLMTINGKERLNDLKKQYNDKKELYNRLYWILEG